MADAAVKIPFTEAAAPSTPASGKVVVYAKSDGLMYSKDDAGTETLMSGGATGSVATDAIWDAAGDLAVGSGANTAAKLALGAAGGAVSRVNGAVAWNSGTAFPTAATGDRYWRTDLGEDFFYDGTRWLSTTLHHCQLADVAVMTPVSATATFGAAGGFGGQHDIWFEDVLYSYFPDSPNDGTHNWTMRVFKSNIGGADAIIAQPTSAAATDDAWNSTIVAVDALAGTTLTRLYLNVLKNNSPGTFRCQAVVTYRRVAT